MQDQQSEYNNLPMSDALREASSESISELLNRDPEGYSIPYDLDRIIAELRANRDRHDLVEKTVTRSAAGRITKADLADIAAAISRPKLNIKPMATKI